MSFDNVDAEALRRPVRWNIKFIERFMLVLGPVSSLFDFITFFALLSLFGAGEAMFQTGWFIESLATHRSLVIFRHQDQQLRLVVGEAGDCTNGFGRIGRAHGLRSTARMAASSSPKPRDLPGEASRTHS